MRKFYLAAGGRWLAAFVVIAGGLSAGFATLMTAGIYAYKGFAPLEPQTREALQTIWLFWLGIGYGIGMVGAVVGALRFVCKRCLGGYRAVPLNCQGEILDEVGAGDYFKIWRKWFFALIWVNAAQAVVVIVVHKLLFGGPVWMGWFNPLWLTPMVMVSGLAALGILMKRCTKVRIEPCAS